MKSMHSFNIVHIFHELIEYLSCTWISNYILTKIDVSFNFISMKFLNTTPPLRYSPQEKRRKITPYRLVAVFSCFQTLLSH